MDNKKLTDEAIVKGLDGADVFLRDLAGSTNTSLDEYAIGILFNIAYLCGDAADLINRQKEEIERLTINANAFALGMKREAEYAKKFVEQLKKELSLLKKECRKHLDNDGEFAIDIVREKVDNLVKEMVGE